MVESETLILSQKDIRQLLSMKETIGIVENAFKDFAMGKTQMIPRKYLVFEKYAGKTGFMPAYIDTLDAAGVKIVSAHDENPTKRRLPRVTATMILTDPQTGLPLAVMDATYTTMMRTGAIGAIAAKHLSRRSAEVVGIIGTGVQGRGQLLGLMEVRGITKALVYDAIPEQSKRFGEEMNKQFGIPVVPADNAQKVVENVDILVTSTNSKTPIIKDEWVRSGLHITSMGVSAPGSQEIPTETFKRSKLVVDDYPQTSVMGGINVPVTQGLLKKEDVFAEIGEIIIGKKLGRTLDSEITTFVTSGLAIQDIAVARLTYEKAKEEGMGKIVRLME
jgi:alanine dehydrogenase